MNHLDLFSGIGGFALAAREVWKDEYNPIAFCDNDKFCQQVLAKNFPGIPIYGDIRTLTNPISQRSLERELKINPTKRNKTLTQSTKCSEASSDTNPRCEQSDKEVQTRGIAPINVDLLTGGFPCQPFSAAGKRKGTEDNRYLWPEMFRVIREFRPEWVIGENVAGLLTISGGLVFEQVCTDLEAEGYEVQPFIIPACSLNAPHKRDRIWIIAHSESWRKRSSKSKRSGDGESPSPSGNRNRIDSNHKQQRLEGRQHPTYQFSGQNDWDKNWIEVATQLCRVDDGLSRRMVRLSDGSTISYPRWRRESLKAYGNAIVPQVAMEIMKGIKEVSLN